MILEPKNDPAKQAHNALFMITNIDVEAIVWEWLDEPLPEREHQEDPPVNQGNGQENGQGNDGGNGQDNQSQEEEEEDNDGGDGGFDHSDSEHTPSQENV